MSNKNKYSTDSKYVFNVIDEELGADVKLTWVEAVCIVLELACVPAMLALLFLSLLSPALAVLAIAVVELLVLKYSPS